MAIYKLQEMPDMQNKGKKRVYPKLVVNRQLNTKEFIEKMHFTKRHHGCADRHRRLLGRDAIHGLHRKVGWPRHLLAVIRLRRREAKGANER